MYTDFNIKKPLNILFYLQRVYKILIIKFIPILNIHLILLLMISFMFLKQESVGEILGHQSIGNLYTHIIQILLRIIFFLNYLIFLSINIYVIIFIPKLHLFHYFLMLLLFTINSVSLNLAVILFIKIRDVLKYLY